MECDCDSSCRYPSYATGHSCAEGSCTCSSDCRLTVTEETGECDCSSDCMITDPTHDHAKGDSGWGKPSSSSSSQKKQRPLGEYTPRPGEYRDSVKQPPDVEKRLRKIWEKFVEENKVEEDDPADADAEIEERLKMWGHWKESKKKSSRSSKGKESKSSESKSEKHEEKTTKSVEVRDVGIQCCLGLLPDIWDVFHIPGLSKPKPDAAEELRGGEFQKESQMVESGRKSSPPKKSSMPTAARGDSLMEPGKKSSAKKSSARNSKMSKQQQRESSVDGRKSTGAAKKSSAMPGKESEAGGKIKKHIFEGHQPYKIERPIYTMLNPPPCVANEALQTDPDVDRFDIILAVAHLEFDKETGMPILDGLLHDDDEEFPRVIVDTPSKCFCNNNENEIYKSPYVKMSNRKQIRKTQRQAVKNIRYQKQSMKRQLSPSQMLSKIASMQSKRQMSGSPDRSPSRRPKRAKMDQFYPTSPLRDTQGRPEWNSSTTLDEPKGGKGADLRSHISDTLDQFGSTFYSRAASGTRSYTPNTSVNSDISEFSASLTAPTKASLARQMHAKFKHCKTHPCDKRGQPGHSHRSQDSINQFDNLEAFDRSQGYGGGFGNEGFGYQGPPATGRSFSFNDIPSVPRGTPRYGKKGHSHCPGPFLPHYKTASRVAFYPKVAVNRGSISKKRRKRPRSVRLPQLRPPGSASRLTAGPKGRKSKSWTSLNVYQGKGKPPIRTKYTDIRIKNVDVVRRPVQFEPGQDPYVYFRKGGKNKSDWKKADKMRKERKKSSERKSEKEEKRKLSSKRGRSKSVLEEEDLGEGEEEEGEGSSSASEGGSQASEDESEGDSVSEEGGSEGSSAGESEEGEEERPKKSSSARRSKASDAAIAGSERRSQTKASKLSAAGSQARASSNLKPSDAKRSSRLRSSSPKESFDEEGDEAEAKLSGSKASKMSASKVSEPKKSGSKLSASKISGSKKSASKVSESKVSGTKASEAKLSGSKMSGSKASEGKKSASKSSVTMGGSKASGMKLSASGIGSKLSTIASGSKMSGSKTSASKSSAGVSKTSLSLGLSKTSASKGGSKKSGSQLSSLSVDDSDDDGDDDADDADDADDDDDAFGGDSISLLPGGFTKSEMQQMEGSDASDEDDSDDDADDTSAESEVAASASLQKSSAKAAPKAGKKGKKGKKKA